MVKNWSSASSPWKMWPAGQAVGVFQILRRDDLVASESADGRLGAYCASVLTTVSPSAPRCLSQSPFQLVGRVLHVDRHHVLALGREEGSVSEGIATSRYGCLEKLPYLDSSKARSR